MGSGSSDVIARLATGVGEDRAAALTELGARGHAGPELALYLRDADAYVAHAAADALVKLGVAQRANLAAIAATLDEARPAIVAKVTRLFAALVGEADAELIAILDTASAIVGDAVIAACATNGLRGLALLQHAARDPRVRVRLHAVRGIALLGVIDPRSAFATLFEVDERDDIADVRAATRAAIAALKVRCMSAEGTRRKQGEPAAPLVPELELRAMTAAELAAGAPHSPVEDLLRLLEAPAAHTRLNALRLLAAKRAVGREVARTLAGRLRDGDVEVRREAAQVLGAAGAAAVAAAPMLVAALADDDRTVIAAAEAALAKLEDGAAAALVDGLDTPSEAHGARVAALLGALADGPARLCAALAFTSLDVRVNAALGIAALGRARAGDAALPALVAVSTAGNARLRAAVVKALAVVEPRPDRAPPTIALDGFETRALADADFAKARIDAGALAAHLGNANAIARANAVVGLAAVADDPRATAELLAVALRDDATAVRVAAVRAIARLGDAAVVAVADALVRALADDAIAADAAAALRIPGADAALVRGLARTPRAVELVVGRANAAELLVAAFAIPGARAAAAAGFATLGKERLGAGRAVLEAAKIDPEAETRAIAARTLRAIDGDPTGPEVPAVAGFETTYLEASGFGGGFTAAQFVPFLGDGRAVVRANAVTGLGTLKAGAGLATTLAPMLRDDDPRVRVAVAKTLDKLGDDAVIAAAPALVDALRTDDATHAACKAALAPRAAKVAAALVAGLETADETHGLRVGELLVALPNAPELVFAAFDGPAQNTQINAALAIGLLGAKRAGTAGRQRLVAGLAGPPTRRRHAVVKALAMLGD